MKKLILNPKIIPATIEHYPIIKNMWHFYIYDMGRYCGLNKGWQDPMDLSFVADDITPYFNNETKKAFLVEVGKEPAGFVFLSEVRGLPNSQWHMEEFFINAKLQNKGIGQKVTHQLWKKHPGIWEISVIPENISALSFWRKTILKFTKNHYSEEVKIADREHGESRYILSFNSTKK